MLSCLRLCAQCIIGGLTIHPRVANFLQCICAKNYENWLAVDKVIAKIIRLTFLAHPVEIVISCCCSSIFHDTLAIAAHGALQILTIIAIQNIVFDALQADGTLTRNTPCLDSPAKSSSTTNQSKFYDSSVSNGSSVTSQKKKPHAVVAVNAKKMFDEVRMFTYFILSYFIYLFVCLSLPN